MTDWIKFLSVAYTEFWDRINYYGLQSILVLYLTQKLGFSDHESLNLFGSYVALAFGLTILGGFSADKIIGVFNAALLGALSIFVGNLILIQQSQLFFYIGLAIIVTGIGFLKPSNPTLIGFMCAGNAYLRTKLFSFFYFYLNMGCIFGPIIYGLAMQKNDCRLCYVLSAFGILSAIIILILQKTSFKQKFESTRKLKIKHTLMMMLIFLTSISGCTFLLIQHNLFFLFLLGIVLIVIVYSLKALKTLSTNEKRSISILIIPFVASTIFFTTLLQLYSSVTFYAENDLDKHFFDWTIPTNWFSLIESIFVSLLLPAMTQLWKWLESKRVAIRTENKIIMGLFIASIAFFIFSFSTQLFKTQIPGYLCTLHLCKQGLINGF